MSLILPVQSTSTLCPALQVRCNIDHTEFQGNQINSNTIKVPDSQELSVQRPTLEVELSPEQANILALCESGSNVFFTGMGGTGKTFLMKRIVERLKKMHGNNAVVTVAPTGVAAIICGGQTLHSFAGCGVPTYVSDFEKCWGGRDMGKRWRNLRVLVVDEVRT